MLLVEPRRAPRSLKAWMLQHRDPRQFPDIAQSCLGNNWSEPVYAYWRRRGGADDERWAGPTTWFWEGVASHQYWTRGRHEPKETISDGG